jgi:hypothetical protein
MADCEQCPSEGTIEDHPIKLLLKSLASDAYVAGLTHRFYRYPARFSPEFVRRAIEVFTQPGDFVLDPFMGGGTTLVEGLAAGRRVVGSDINALAGFITKAKITPLTSSDRKEVQRWQFSLKALTSLRRREPECEDWVSYQRNLPWWLRKTLALAREATDAIESVRARRFARASLLRTAQWALDCRTEIPNRDQLLVRHAEDVEGMLLGVAELRHRLREVFGAPQRAVTQNSRVLVRSAVGLHRDKRIPSTWGAPRLVLTSPPYVGVHILYHRWQVRGRRETAAPYWLAGCLDGKPNSFYNFAERRQKTMDGYLSAMRASFESVIALMDGRSMLVQLVAFARPSDQLPPYLEALERLGLNYVGVPGLPPLHFASRLVPNRKWYADWKGPLGASQEFLLVHSKNLTGRGNTTQRGET